MSDAAEKRLLLIDGSGFIFRAYHALPPLTRPDGTPVNAVMGFCNMLVKLLEDHAAGPDAPTHVAVIFDAARKTFRSDLYPEYKAHRPEPPEDLRPQFSIIKEAARAFTLPSIEMQGYEADDIIATYARMGREAGMKVTIVSSDKDLMQLVVDGEIEMQDAMKAKRIASEEVFAKFGVGPDKVIDVQALCGDSADNVPGVPGIGVKTAAQLIDEYGNLEDLLDRADEIKQPKRRQNLIEHADLARISKQLVTLEQHVPLEDSLDDLVLKPREYETLFAFLAEQGFKSLAAKLKTAAVEEGLDDYVEDNADFPPIKADDYECVTSMDRLDAWIAEAHRLGYVAVDTETTDLHAVKAELVGISLATEPGKACYIPVDHKDPESWGKETAPSDDLFAAPDDKPNHPDQLTRDQVLEKLRPLLVDPAVLKIGQNIKYDMVVLSKYDAPVAPIDDTMLISATLDAGRGRHGMDDLAKRHLDHECIAYKDLVGTGKKQITFDYVSLDTATRYAAEDADVTLRLWLILKPRLAEFHLVSVYETMERPLIPVIAAMEAEGIRVDTQTLARLSNDFALEAERLEAEIHDLAGEPFNIGSPKQLGEILFDKLGLPGGKKSKKTGAWQTGVEVLEGLAAEGHEMPEKIVHWRHVSKLRSTYTEALQREALGVESRVHTAFSLAATTTGRLASSDPNLQNIPIRTEEGRKIRTAFVPKPGHVLLAADYSQVELRLLAHIADIESLKQAFRDGEDIHALTASQVFDVPIEGMDPMVRRNAKAINFGIIYGMSAFGLARQLKIPQKEAKAYIDAYFTRYPGIRQYMDDTIEFCKQHGYVETLFGRRAHMANINDKNPSMRNFSERAAINAPIQGAAADIIKRAMIKLPGALEAAGLKTKMLLQVHDELLFEAPQSEVEAVKALIRPIMEGAANLDVPLIVDIGEGQNWAEAH